MFEILTKKPWFSGGKLVTFAASPGFSVRQQKTRLNFRLPSQVSSYKSLQLLIRSLTHCCRTTKLLGTEKYLAIEESFFQGDVFCPFRDPLKVFACYRMRGGGGVPVMVAVVVFHLVFLRG